VLTPDGRLWSVDALGRPYRAAAGTDVDDLWLACQATVGTVDRGQLYRVWGVLHPDLECVGFALPRTVGSTRNTDLLWFDRATGDYVGRWRLAGGDMAWGALCTDADGETRLVVLTHSGTPYVVWRTAEADADAAKALDVSAAGSALVPTRVVLAEAQAEGADQKAFIQWTTLILETGDPHDASIPPQLSGVSTGTTLTYACETPGHPFGTNPHDFRVVTVGRDGRKEVGLARWGRWMRLRLTPASGPGSERFRVWRVTAVGSIRDAASGRR
jgi:hypothetical protein